MGKSKFNPIFEFDYKINNQTTTYRVTSVLGHLMGVEFPESCKNWHATKMEDLFHVPVLKSPAENSLSIIQNLKQFCRDCNDLIIWTDCDREGEAIGFDIIDLCKQTKNNLDVYRAKFSALTKEDLENAALNLERPKKSLSDAVNVR